MSNVTNTAKSTITTLLGTISTAANVTTAALNSTNIIALDMQERTQNWADNAKTERKLNQGTAIKQAKINYAQNQANQYGELQAWLKQHPDRVTAFEAAMAEADNLLSTQ